MARRSPKPNTWRRHSPSGPTLRERLADRFIPDGAWRRMAARRIHHLHGPKSVSPGGDGLVVVCLLRDGVAHVEDFVRHHLDIGSKHLVFLDNGSSDGTVEALRGYGEGVTVLTSGLPYRDYCLLMKQHLMREYGSGGWVLCADIDERFAFPFADAGVARLVSYLDRRAYTAVVGQMLDLFPTGSLASRDLPGDQTYYDLSNVTHHDYGPAFRNTNTVSNEDIKLMRGGVRKSLFGVNAGLTKHPLVKMDGEAKPMANSSHKVRNARIADFSTVLLHYKFLGDFHEHVRRAVDEGNYYDSSSEYRKYLDALDADTGIAVSDESVRKLGNIDELVESGFLTVSPEYREWMTAK